MLILIYFIKYNSSITLIKVTSLKKQNIFWNKHIVSKNFQKKSSINHFNLTLFSSFFSHLWQIKSASDVLFNNYVKVIELDSDNDFFDLFYLYDWFTFYFINKIATLNVNYNVKIYKVNFLNKTNYLALCVIILHNIFKKNKSLYIRSKFFSGWFVALVKSLKLVRLKRRRTRKKLRIRKSALTFFQKRYFYSFIRFKRRLLKNIKKKKYKKKIKSRIKTKTYKVLLYNLKNKIRFNLKNVILSQLKKKLFFSETSLKKNKLNIKNNFNNYNLNLILFNSLNKERQYFIFKNLNVLKNIFFPKMFAFFISLFFEKLTNKKTLLRLNTNTRLSNFELYWVNYFSKKYFFIQKQFRGVLHLNEFIYILLLTFKHKDLFFLKNWLSNFLEKISLKKHKTFLRAFKRISLSLLSTSAHFLNVKGFLFDIRGKVGVSGNAKKRHNFIKYKRYGFTKIQFKAEHTKFIIRTNTGVLGVTLVLTY